MSCESRRLPVGCNQDGVWIGFYELALCLEYFSTSLSKPSTPFALRLTTGRRQIMINQDYLLGERHRGCWHMFAPKSRKELIKDRIRAASRHGVVAPPRLATQEYELVTIASDLWHVKEDPKYHGCLVGPQLCNVNVISSRRYQWLMMMQVLTIDISKSFPPCTISSIVSVADTLQVMRALHIDMTDRMRDNLWDRNQEVITASWFVYPAKSASQMSYYAVHDEGEA